MTIYRRVLYSRCTEFDVEISKVPLSSIGELYGTALLDPPATLLREIT
jgi:hypothetical protein